MYYTLEFDLSLHCANMFQDLDSKIDVLTTKFIDTDIKALEDELADRPVQTRFDKNAMKCLNKWENLVCRSLMRICELTLTC
jgi:hypothetical protein